MTTPIDDYLSFSSFCGAVAADTMDRLVAWFGRNLDRHSVFDGESSYSRVDCLLQPEKRLVEGGF